MKEYQDLVRFVIENGHRKRNRTGVDTLCSFGYHYKVDLSKGFPLLTTKKIYVFIYQDLNIGFTY